jgi:hypothetical protein
MLRRYGFILTAALLLSAAHANALTLANVVDLRTAGSSGTANGALFTQLATDPTGTGYIDPFLRLQDSPIEEAFNTDYRSTGQAPLDAKSDPNFTHSLTVGSLATITQGGVDYYKFTLDIDEPNSGPFRYISLDDFELYVADRGNIESLATLHSEGVLKWDMDGAGDATVYLNGGNLSSGNGSDDMQVLIPKSFFAGVDPSKYLYLYSKFGATSGMGADNYDANASFEEWRALTTTPPPSAAEPGTLTLLGGGLLGLAIAGLRRKKSA